MSTSLKHYALIFKHYARDGTRTLGTWSGYNCSNAIMITRIAILASTGSELRCLHCVFQNWQPIWENILVGVNDIVCIPGCSWLMNVRDAEMRRLIPTYRTHSTRITQASWQGAIDSFGGSNLPKRCAGVWVISCRSRDDDEVGRTCLRAPSQKQMIDLEHRRL